MKAYSGILLLTWLLSVPSSSGFAQNQPYPDLPQRGATQQHIQEKFGSPDVQNPAVGDPPITRWLYPDFTVVFEYDRVIHAFPRSSTVENLPLRSRQESFIMPDSQVTNDSTPAESTGQETPEHDTATNNKPALETGTGSFFIEDDDNNPVYEETSRPNNPEQDENPVLEDNEYDVDSSYESDIPVD